MPTKPSYPANRVRELRKAAGMTLAELAEAMVPPADLAGLQKIETRQRNLTHEWIERIARALGVPPTSLIDEAPPAGVAWVPVIGSVSAGAWEEAVAEPLERVPVINPPRDAFALRPDGTSMNLLIPDGGYVVVAPHDRTLRDGRVYVAQREDGTATVKRFRLGEPPMFEPCSTEDHAPITLGEDPIRVIGRVVQAVSPL